MSSDLAKNMRSVLQCLKFDGYVYRGPLLSMVFSQTCHEARLSQYLHSASRGHFKHLYIAWGASADDAETQCSPYIRKSLAGFFLRFTKIENIWTVPQGFIWKAMSMCEVKEGGAYVSSVELISGSLLLPSSCLLSQLRGSFHSSDSVFHSSVWGN